MADKKSGLKKFFSGSNKDCCSIDIKEVKLDEKDSCCGPSDEKNENQKKEV